MKAQTRGGARFLCLIAWAAAASGCKIEGRVDGYRPGDPAVDVAIIAESRALREAVEWSCAHRREKTAPAATELQRWEAAYKATVDSAGDVAAARGIDSREWRRLSSRLDGLRYNVELARRAAQEADWGSVDVSQYQVTTAEADIAGRYSFRSWVPGRTYFALVGGRLVRIGDAGDPPDLTCGLYF